MVLEKVPHFKSTTTAPTTNTNNKINAAAKPPISRQQANRATSSFSKQFFKIFLLV
jgi:hypothetical protein